MIDTVTVVCAKEGCEDWGWRGPEPEGWRIAGDHSKEHAGDQHQMAGPPGQVSVIRDIPGESERERAGRIVREVWVQEAHESGDTNPSHLTPWPLLNRRDRAIDEHIGAALAADRRVREAEASREPQRLGDVLAALAPGLRRSMLRDEHPDLLRWVGRDAEAGS